MGYCWYVFFLDWKRVLMGCEIADILGNVDKEKFTNLLRDLKGIHTHLHSNNNNKHLQTHTKINTRLQRRPRTSFPPFPTPVLPTHMDALPPRIRPARPHAALPPRNRLQRHIPQAQDISQPEIPPHQPRQQAPISIQANLCPQSPLFRIDAFNSFVFSPCAAVQQVGWQDTTLSSSSRICRRRNPRMGRLRPGRHRGESRSRPTHG